MTISVTNSLQTFEGNGSNTIFTFSFPAVSAADITVLYTDSNDVLTTLSPASYTVTMNPVAPGSLWSIGGVIEYPLSGSPIASGTSITIQRVLPLQQTADISNQGNVYPTVTEQALDTLCMEIQQISARTGAFRGTWQISTVYNYGDIVQDGAAGANSSNYYMCIIANTSTTWVADLANGDWQLIITSVFPTTSLPLSIANGGTGQITAAAALSALGAVSLSGTNVFTGSNNFTVGSALVTTRSPGDNSNYAASTAFVTAANALLAPVANPVFTGTATAALFSGPTVGVTNGSSAAAGNVGQYIESNIGFGGGSALANGVAADITSIPVTAGDWDVWGSAGTDAAVATTTSQIQGWISIVSATAPGDANGGAYFNSGASLAAGVNSMTPVGMKRISVTVPTTVYLSIQASFSFDAMSSWGFIGARRIR